MAQPALKKSSSPAERMALTLVPAEAQSSVRLRLLDQFRGLAVVFMMAYHFLFDVWQSHPNSIWFGTPIKDWSPAIWYWGSAFIGTLFYFTAGVAARSVYERQGPTNAQKVFFKKALKLGFFAAIVSAGSYFFARENFIFFGTLHCFALTMFCLPFCLRVKNPGGLGAGFLLGFWTLSFLDFYPYIGNTGIFLGLLSSEASYGGDYFPLLPWLGVALLGFAFAPRFPRWELRIPVLDFLGRNALAIYLIHQPILIFLVPYLKF